MTAIFEGEPRLSDPDVPWFYNKLAFVLPRSDEKIDCAIESADHLPYFTWSIDGRTVIRLQLAAKPTVNDDRRLADPVPTVTGSFQSRTRP